MKRHAWCFLLAITGILLALAAQAAPFNHSNWNALLKKHVVVIRGGKATQVNYTSFATDRAQLKQYLTGLSQVSKSAFDAWREKRQLAFLINAYNAWTVELILSAHQSIKSIKDLGSWLRSPWEKRFIPLFGKNVSLDDIEHDFIRGSGRYNDPRIHFAVNCASIGCPALRQEAYEAARLDAQLDDATNLYLADRTRNRLDGKTLQVSSIFKWYREDFEAGWRNTHSLMQYLAHYRSALCLSDEQAKQLVEGKIQIDYLDYDWALNNTKRHKK